MILQIHGRDAGGEKRIKKKERRNHVDDGAAVPTSKRERNGDAAQSSEAKMHERQRKRVSP